MTEFEYDSYLKKNIARSAKYRKRGSKSRKCPLSTDHMTRKQWEERCGEVVSYQIGRPMVWAEFSKLPSDLKEEYMNGLIQKYSANARNMADMFGVSVATVFRVVKKEGLNVEFLRGRYPSGSKEVEFQKFLCGNDESLGGYADAPELKVMKRDEPNVDVPTKENAESVKEPANKTRLDGFTMNFSGETDIDMIANSLRYILGSKKSAKIQIVCEIE